MSPISSSTVADWMEPAEAHASEVRKLSTLLEASQALSVTLDLEAGLQRVLEILGRHHGAVRSTVVLLNDQTGEVELQASAGAIQPGQRVRYALGEGITGQVVQSGRPIVVPRVSRQASRVQATDQACAGAPRGWCGGSPSKISPIVPIAWSTNASLIGSSTACAASTSPVTR